MSWNWWVSQVLAFVGLVFVVTSNQQKTTIKLLLFRNLATLFVFVGVCFLGELSAIIMGGAGVLRNLVSLVFAIKKSTNKTAKVLASVVISILLVVLNIIFWKSLLNLYSILLGIWMVIAFMQEKAKTIRAFGLVAEIFSIIYFILLGSPVNIIIEVFGLISVIVGIIRLDINKRGENPQQ